LRCGENPSYLWVRWLHTLMHTHIIIYIYIIHIYIWIYIYIHVYIHDIMYGLSWVINHFCTSQWRQPYIQDPGHPAVRLCSLCGMPLPERTDRSRRYVQRSDCGNQSLFEHPENKKKPLVQFTRSWAKLSC